MDYAELAKGAYQYPTEVAGYTIDEKLSDKDSTVYLNDHEAVLAVSGTKSLRDLPDDVRILQGTLRNSDRYDREKQKLRQMIRENLDKNIVIVGHSLGASLAIELQRDNNYFKDKEIEVYAYNTGTSPMSVAEHWKDKAKCKFFRDRKQCKKLHQTTSGFDPLSVLSLLNGSDWKPSKVIYNPHTIKNHTGGSLYQFADKGVPYENDIVVQPTGLYKVTKSPRNRKKNWFETGGIRWTHDPKEPVVVLKKSTDGFTLDDLMV